MRKKPTKFIRNIDLFAMKFFNIGFKGKLIVQN